MISARLPAAFHVLYPLSFLSVRIRCRADILSDNLYRQSMQKVYENILCRQSMQAVCENILCRPPLLSACIRQESLFQAGRSGILYHPMILLLSELIFLKILLTRSLICFLKTMTRPIRTTMIRMISNDNDQHRDPQHDHHRKQEFRPRLFPQFTCKVFSFFKRVFRFFLQDLQKSVISSPEVLHKKAA